MSEPQNIATENYFDATNTIRHYDSQRAAFSRLSLSALALLVAFSATQIEAQNHLNFLQLLSALTMLLSCLSVIILIKFNNLIARQRVRARVSIRLLEEVHDIKVISQIDDEVCRICNTWIVSRLSLNSLWIGLFALFFVLGAVGLFYSTNSLVLCPADSLSPA